MFLGLRKRKENINWQKLILGGPGVIPAPATPAEVRKNNRVTHQYMTPHRYKFQSHPLGASHFIARGGGGGSGVF